MDLEGRVILVTGGGTGLGQAIVLAAAARGANVAINYSRSGVDAEEVAAEARALGVEARTYRASVSDPRAVDDMVAAIEESLGPLVGLVNNAGVTRGVPFADLAGVTAADWTSALEVNLLGAWHCARAATARMRVRGEGAVLNIASDSAVSLSGSSIPYVVSKAALVALTRCLARALAPEIRVNALAPGWMQTRWLDSNLAEDQRAFVNSGAARVVNLADASSMALELLLNDSMTGQAVVIDAGDAFAPPIPVGVRG